MENHEQLTIFDLIQKQEQNTNDNESTSICDNCPCTNVPSCHLCKYFED